MAEGLNFQIEKIAGQAGETAECGVFNKKIILGSGEVGNLVSCVLVENAQEPEAQAIIRDIFEVAVRKLDEGEGSILEMLKGVLNNSRSYLEDQHAAVSFVTVFFYKEVCYVARFGNDVKLLVFGDSKKAEIEFEIGSGPVSSGQTFLVASSNFLSLFDDSTFNGEQIDLSEIIDGLATEISAKEDQANIGAVFIKVEGESGSQVLERPQEDVLEETADKKEVNQTEEQVERHEYQVEDVNPDEQPKEGGLSDGYERHDVREEKTSIVSSLLAGLTSTFGRLRHEVFGIRRGEIGAILRLRRNILAIVVVIILILVGIAGYQIYKKDQVAKTAEIQQHLTLARSKFSEGSAIVELNKTKARQILIEAQDEAKAAQKIDGANKDVLSLLTEIADKLKQTEASTSINFSTFADIGSSVGGLVFNGSQINVFGADKIYQLDSSGKSVGDLGNYSGFKAGVVFDNKAFVLTNDQVFRLDFGTEKVTKIVDDNGSKDVGVFFGNVYLLGDKQISKIVPIEGGYSEPSDYLDHETSFGQGSRMSIDSLIWVTNGDKILKFNRGRQEDFSISGLPEGSGDFSIIYTDSGLSNLYVIDHSNSVLLVISKDGVFQKALSSPEFGKATAILVNSKEDKVFVAVDSKILTTSLK